MTIEVETFTPHAFKLRVGNVVEMLRALVKYANSVGDFEAAGKAKSCLNKLITLQGGDKLFGLAVMLDFDVEVLEVESSYEEKKEASK